jgi:hypothetical protein
MFMPDALTNRLLPVCRGNKVSRSINNRLARYFEVMDDTKMPQVDPDVMEILRKSNDPFTPDTWVQMLARIAGEQGVDIMNYVREKTQGLSTLEQNRIIEELDQDPPL